MVVDDKSLMRDFIMHVSSSYGIIGLPVGPYQQGIAKSISIQIEEESMNSWNQSAERTN